MYSFCLSSKRASVCLISYATGMKISLPIEATKANSSSASSSSIQIVRAIGTVAIRTNTGFNASTVPDRERRFDDGTRNLFAAGREPRDCRRRHEAPSSTGDSAAGAVQIVDQVHDFRISPTWNHGRRGPGTLLSPGTENVSSPLRLARRSLLILLVELHPLAEYEEARTVIRLEIGRRVLLVSQPKAPGFGRGIQRQVQHHCVKQVKFYTS